MLNITHYQRNANQNHNEIPSHAKSEWLLSKSLQTINAAEGAEKKATLLYCWQECKLVQTLWRTVWRFLKKLERELPYDPAIPLLGIHTEETRIDRDTYTPVLIAALFTIARTWKQPRCSSADEWIRNLWYVYTMEYYSVFKNNAFESVLMQWMKLKPITQSEVSQNEKHQYSIQMYPCLVPDFRGNVFNFPPLRIMFAVGLSYIAFIMLRYIPSIPAFWRVFIINGCEFCQRPSLHLLR